MADYVVIDGNKVVNIIVADSLEIAQEVTGKTCILREEQYVCIGDTWDGENFTRPDVEESVA